MVIASHNPDKLREIAELLAPYGLKIEAAAALGLDEPEETGSTFEANAELKARRRGDRLRACRRSPTIPV